MNFSMPKWFKVTQSEAQLEAGERPPRRAKKSVARDRKIEELKERFRSNSISLDEYVRGMSSHTNV